MKKFIKFAQVSSRRSDDFTETLQNKVEEFQSENLECDVSYQHSQGVFSALVSGYVLEEVNKLSGNVTFTAGSVIGKSGSLSNQD